MSNRSPVLPDPLCANEQLTCLADGFWIDRATPPWGAIEFHEMWASPTMQHASSNHSIVCNSGQLSAIGPSVN